MSLGNTNKMPFWQYKKKVRFWSLHGKTCQELVAISIFLWTPGLIHKFKMLLLYLRAINPKGNQPWIFTGGLMLKLKFQYFGHLMQRVTSLEKTLIDAGIDWRKEEKGTTEDEMFGWHHRLNRHESGWTLGDSEGQGLYCSLWGLKESDMTEHWNNKNIAGLCWWFGGKEFAC